MTISIFTCAPRLMIKRRQLGAKQLQLLGYSAKKLPEGSTIAIALDNDQKGQRDTKESKMYLRGSQDLYGGIVRRAPTLKDWNEDLKASHQARLTKTGVEMEAWKRSVRDG